ncbi:MAG: sugar phosphate isomerase/epimerase [Clostridia bacterium]|nr:sugar phosphate isomerase/epimerase [Clostridia bacterium]
MWKCKLALKACDSFGVPIEQVMPQIAQVGFEACFAEWKSAEQMAQIAALAKDCGLEIQSMHAPFRMAAQMWEGPDEAADAGTDRLVSCIKDCARHEVPVAVCHAYIGFEDKPHVVTQKGLARYERVLRAAEGTGVKVAFENTEGEEFLAALFENFGDHPNIGFCWDSGHEMCYNHSQDMLGLYGKYVCATHLNDNAGIKDYAGVCNPLDDLHLLPMDGIADWTVLAERLAATGFDGPLTFELKRHARAGRHETDRYMRIPLEEYLANCYISACRVGALFEKARKMQKNA